MAALQRGKKDLLRRESILLVVMGLAVLLALKSVICHAWIDYWLLNDGQPESAVVTAKGSHGWRSYRYTVKEAIYTGYDQVHFKQAEQRVPYETSAFFSASRPWISGLRSGERRVCELPPLLIVIIGWSLFLMACVAYMRFGEQDRQPRRPMSRNLDEAMLRLALPVGRSWWAIAAGYVGLFAMLGIPAPLAIACGGIAVVHLRHNPQLHGWGRALFGLVMGVVFTIVLIWVSI